MTSRQIILHDHAVLPKYEDLKKDSWHIMQPNTGKCLDGSDWYFGLRTGSKNGQINVHDIHIYFNGGGVCWSQDLMNKGLCNTGVRFSADDGFLGSWNLNSDLDGLWSEDSRNEFKDWSLVLVPYCSGDVFLGTPNGYSGLNHNGANMTFTVLDWMVDVFSSATNVLISGISAGAIASLFYAQFFQNAFSSRVKITYFSDSAIYPDFNVDVLVTVLGGRERFNATQLCLGKNGAEWYYCMTSKYSFPGVFFTYTDDTIQKTYASLLSPNDDWSCATAELLERMVISNENVGYYTKPGTLHGIIYKNDFFVPNSEGVSPASFLLPLVKRNVCSYKNFTSELLGTCEYEVSDITGICSLSKKQSGLNYVIIGVPVGVACCLVFCLLGLFFRHSKNKISNELEDDSVTKNKISNEVEIDSVTKNKISNEVEDDSVIITN